MPNTSQINPFVTSLGGGLVLNKDVFSMAPGEALELTNFEPDIKGGYKKILGTTKFNTNIVPQVTTPTERVVFSAIFNDVVLAGRGGSIHYASSGSGSWTSLITGLGTPTRNYEFRQFNFSGTDNLIICSGTSTPRIVDTSYTVTNVNATGSGNFKHVEIFKNHIFFSGDSSSPQSVKFMAPFKTNDFATSSGGGEIRVESTVVGLKVFRDNLFIFCTDEIFKLVGSSSADFQLQPVTRKIGCVDGRSIQEFAGDVIFLAPDGLRTVAGTDKIGDVELGTISKQVQEIIDDITTHNINSLIIREKSQYRLFYPTSLDQSENAAEGLAAVIKINPNTGGLGFEYSQLRGLKVSSCDSGFISGVENVVSGGYDGYVYKQESGNVFTRASESANINAFYRTPDMTMGDPGIRKSLQRVIWNYQNEGNVSATFKVRYDFDSPDTPQPQAYTLSTGAGIAVYGLAASTYGTAVYGSSGANLVRQSVEGSGFTVALRVQDESNNLPISFKGYQLEFIPGGRR
jgi:hypothetical protein